MFKSDTPVWDSGALYLASGVAWGQIREPALNAGSVTAVFRADRYSTIYQDGAPVRPNSTKTLMYIKF